MKGMAEVSDFRRRQAHRTGFETDFSWLNSLKHALTLKEDEDMTYKSVNPYDGKVLKTFEEFTDKQLEMALETAATCFETWRHTTFAERAAVVAKAAAIMHARVDEFARPFGI